MGQLMSICGLLYVRDCNINEVVNDLTLFPPYPVFYKITEDHDYFTGRYGFDSVENVIPSCIKIMYLPVTSDLSICAMHCKIQNAKQVLIISHGNSFDNGCYIKTMMIYAKDLNMDCIVYDYEGFGCSDGVTNCNCFERDITAVYNYATQFFEGKDIFLLVGSVACCCLGATLYRSFDNAKINDLPCSEPLGGIILNGAFYSGKTAISAGCLLLTNDPYDNAENIQYIRCPIFHIHGIDDEIIPIFRGKQLYAASKTSYAPWWVSDGTHRNLLMRNEKEYIGRLNDFFHYCNQLHV